MLSAEDAIVELRRGLQRVEVAPSSDDPDMTGFYPEDARSDHLPREFHVPLTLDKVVVKVATLNLLNPKYYKHHHEKDGQGLSGFRKIVPPEHFLSGSAEMEAFDMDRMREQLQWIKKMATDGFFVCLQECCPRMLEMLRGLVSPEIDFRIDAANKNADNLNVTVFRPQDWKPECDMVFTHEGGCIVAARAYQSAGRQGVAFILCNVHMPWRSADRYAKALMGNGWTNYFRDIIMVGDFNITARPAATADSGDTIEVFRGCPFLFAMPMPTEPPFTSVNKLRNAGCRSKMLDVLDYCILYPIDQHPEWKVDPKKQEEKK